MRTLTHDAYTVGWICALPTELAASITMLDEEDSLLPSPRSDPNTYTLGRVGQHNVVMACLPVGHTGTNPAATVAAYMKNSFKMIRFGLMVGIGGGVPSAKNDIRLGDVVVSEPNKRSGGVLQYDFGRTEQGEQFVRTGSLNAPPEVLLTALGKLQANHVVDRNGVAHYLSQIPPALQPKFASPGVEWDRLFEVDYVHRGGDRCEQCDVSKLVPPRTPRLSPDPVVHYGTIASGNRVIKDSITRQRLATEESVLCFETEAAGLINNFPCVVIRGICDYSDSHKNKQWQPYAAVTAAAYAKDLLSVIPPEQVADTATIPTPVHTPAPITAPASISGDVPLREMIHPSGTEQPDISHSSSARASPAPKPSFFSQYRLFPYNSVALGRLVVDTRYPWQDYCPVPVNLTTDDIAITDRPRLRETLENAKGSRLYHKLRTIFSGVIDDGDFPSVQEKTYLLLNSGNCFRTIAREKKAQEWFETTIKYGWNVYMVVGIHTIHESSIRVSDLETRLAALDANLGGGNGGVTFGSPIAGEIVFAVQYRKVQFSWFSSRKLEHGYLNVGCTRWKVVPISGRADAAEEEDDVVEANLQDSIVKEDIEDGEVYMASNEVIVV